MSMTGKQKLPPPPRFIFKQQKCDMIYMMGSVSVAYRLIAPQKYTCHCFMQHSCTLENRNNEVKFHLSPCLSDILMHTRHVV